MGFRMKITGGSEPIDFDERSITKVDFDSKSAMDSNARATDYSLSVKVWGKMLYKLGGEGNDPTLGLAQWSQVPSEKADCYRNAEISVISGSASVYAAKCICNGVFRGGRRRGRCRNLLYSYETEEG